MVTEKDLATTALSVSYELEPTRNIVGDLSGLTGGFCNSLVGAFYPRNIARKANVVVTELFNNAVAYNSNGTSRISVRLSIADGALKVRVQNAATQAQCARVKAHLAAIRAAADPRKLLGDTIRLRHREKLPGGLGLIRLHVENKFSVTARSRGGTLTVEASIPVGGTE